ncbi:hypothetical protein V5O48_013544 [Marasmius crinis-equi]|uniref:Fibronectin type-III domain-containing protein n=1 Tax=Marasmius crinis-equi TaxID=585013 RepID=A0ABR3EZS0_9AGAR
MAPWGSSVITLLLASSVIWSSKGFQIDRIPVDPSPVEGAKVSVSWSRDTAKDPRLFEFEWLPISDQFPEMDSLVEVGASDASGTTELTFPPKGQYRLAILSDPTASPLFTSDQAIEVGGNSTTSGSSTSSGGAQTSTQTSGLATQTPGPSGSHSTSLGQILGATLAGLFALSLVISGIRLRSRHKHQRQAHARRPEPDLIDPELTVDPLPSGLDAETRQSRPASKKLEPTPEPVQHTAVVEASDVMNTDTTVSEPPPPANALPVVDESRVGPFAGFTTDELVLELNQRIQTEDGQWDENETLPEYPGSERGDP